MRVAAPFPAASGFAGEIDTDGTFRRQGDRFTGRVTADGSGTHPVEPDRYQLIASLATPRSHCTLIARRLLGLEDAIGLSTVEYAAAAGGDGTPGWRFTAENGDDPAIGPRTLAEIYRESDPDYRDRVTVPVLYDRETRRIVSNDFSEILRDLSTEWRKFHARDAPQLFPRAHRARIQAFNALVRSDIGEGVYRCGLAASQQSYDDAYRRLFDRLDWFSMFLSMQRYLVCDHITETDILLFATLVRFDVAYHDVFGCNREKLTEMPTLWAYARDLFQSPRVGDTVDFEQIRRHYHSAFRAGRPGAVVPAGPDLSGWHTAHGRDEPDGRTGEPDGRTPAGT